jgi:acyl-CoA reductase-like NAD-dependent aldehyde dehydrogenase
MHPGGPEEDSKMDDLRDRLVRKGNYIYGSFIKPESVDGYINCVNPGDRTDILGRFPFSEAAVNDAVVHAQRGFETLKSEGLNDRASLVRRFREQVFSQQEPISRLLSRETGKPVWEARQEIVGAIRDIDLYLDEGLGLLAPRLLSESGARSDYVARGVVAVLCPYTYPFRVAATRTAAAVLAGNAVVYKPSKFTPAVGQSVAELWDRVRAPRGVVNMIQGSGSVVGQKLITHPGVGALLATCSFKTSMAVRRAVFERPELPVVYETGGKGIAIVLADANLEQAVYEVMVGAFLTAGQRHNSTGRVIVEDAIYDGFVQRLVERSTKIEIGYGFRDNVFMGPLISENLRTRFRKYNRAVGARGTRLCSRVGHSIPGPTGAFTSPPAFTGSTRIAATPS